MKKILNAYVCIVLILLLSARLAASHAAELPTPEKESSLQERVEAMLEKSRRPRPSAEELQAKITALLQKTRSQMRPIKGGSFWQGDFCVLIPSKPEGGKVRYHPPKGPKAPIVGLPCSIDMDNKPPRWVTLDGFYMQSHKVTYGDFDIYVWANQLPAHPPLIEEDLNAAQGLPYHAWRSSRTSDDVPAGVFWQQAKGYCQWLGKQTGLPFDLPSEAQWEFAASNGVNSWARPYPTQSGLKDDLTTNPTWEKWEALIKAGMPFGQQGAGVYKVGLYAPSPNGLYDLFANGLEWMDDWYAADAYAKTAARNPRGPATGTDKVLRGDMFFDSVKIGYSYLLRYYLNIETPANDIDKYKKKHQERAASPYYNNGFRCVIQRAGRLNWPGEP